jgi:hypothetical protein
MACNRRRRVGTDTGSIVEKKLKVQDVAAYTSSNQGRACRLKKAKD